MATEEGCHEKYSQDAAPRGSGWRGPSYSWPGIGPCLGRHKKCSEWYLTGTPRLGAKDEGWESSRPTGHGGSCDGQVGRIVNLILHMIRHTSPHYHFMCLHGMCGARMQTRHPNERQTTRGAYLMAKCPQSDTRNCDILRYSPKSSN